MSSEIQFQTSPVTSAGTFYAVIRNNAAQVWRTDTLVFEAYADAHFVHYAVSMIEQGSSGYYTADFPSQIAAGVYGVVTYQQTGGNPAPSDIIEADGLVHWSGSATLTVPATPDDWTTLDYVKTHLQITTTSYDNWIQQYLTAASRAARTFINNRQLLSTSYQEVRNGKGTDYVRVFNYPVISLTQVLVQYQQPDQTTVANTEFVVDQTTGIVKFKVSSGFWQPFNTGFQNVRIDYVGGYATIPWDVQTAVAIIVGKLLFTQNLSGMNVAEKKVKDVDIKYFNPLTLNLNNPLFAEATAILELYKNRSY